MNFIMNNDPNLENEIDSLSRLFKTLSVSETDLRTEIFEEAKNLKYMNYVIIKDTRNNVTRRDGYVDYKLATHSVNMLLEKIHKLFLKQQNNNKLNDFFKFYDFICGHAYIMSFCSFVLRKSRKFFEDYSKQSSLLNYLNELTNLFSNGIQQKEQKNIYKGLEYDVAEITNMLKYMKL